MFYCAEMLVRHGNVLLALLSTTVLLLAAGETGAVNEVRLADERAAVRMPFVSGDTHGLVGLNGLGIWSINSGKKIGPFDALNRTPFKLSPRGKVAWFRETGRTTISGLGVDVGTLEVSNLSGSGRFVVERRVLGVSELAWSRDGRTLYYFYRTGRPGLESAVSWFNIGTKQRGTYAEGAELDTIQSGLFGSVAVSPSGREIAAVVSVLSYFPGEANLVVLQLDRAGSYRKLRKNDALAEDLDPVAWTSSGIIAHRKRRCGGTSQAKCRSDLVLVAPASGKIVRTLRTLPAKYPFVVATTSGRWFVAADLRDSVVGSVRGGALVRHEQVFDDIEESG